MFVGAANATQQHSERVMSEATGAHTQRLMLHWVSLQIWVAGGVLEAHRIAANS
jgi:hypothetical protein